LHKRQGWVSIIHEGKFKTNTSLTKESWKWQSKQASKQASKQVLEEKTKASSQTL